MLALGAPAYLVAAALAAAAVVALHLLAWRRPTPAPFPTARFIPDAPVRAVSRDLRLTDAALLALRVVALLAAGLALSQPRPTATPSGSARVILADRSRAVASESELRDSVRTLADGADAVRLVAFDSAAATADLADTASLARSDRRGSLSAGLIVALREAGRLAHRFARVEIVLVSPVAREELDDATRAVRALWPDTIRLARVRARTSEAAVAEGASVIPPASDAVGAAMRLAIGARAADSSASTPRAAALRVVRGVPSPDDSAAARTGALLVVWPESSQVVTSATAAPARARAVTAGGRTVVAPLAPRPGELAGRPVAWWEDGSVAAAESAFGAGCVRQVGFLPPTAGDLPLRPAFVDLVAAMSSPCGGADWRAVPSTELGWLTSPADPPGAGEVRDRRPSVREESTPTLALSLLLLALAALLAEWWLRRRRATAPVPAARAVPRSREAA